MCGQGFDASLSVDGRCSVCGSRNAEQLIDYETNEPLPRI